MKSWSKKTLVRHIQIAIALGTANGLTAGLALAQTPPQTPAATKTELETVVITAQRRAENQQVVPVAVTAVSAEQLAERNITDMSQMEGMSPGFTFSRSGNDARPAMRGVRTENVAINGDTTIGYFVDGIYKSRAQQALASFVDLSRVEIQRGPQGTLYGRNTFGGNVSVVTNAPVMNAWQQSASFQTGSFNKMRTEAMFNVPVNEVLALRLVGVIDKADGYVKNTYNPDASLFDQDLLYGRIGFKLKPNDRLEATLRVDVTEQGGNGGSAFGYKQAGTYYHTASCQQLFNSTQVILNGRPGNRDGVNDCVRTVGAGAGTGANAIGAGVDLGIPITNPGNAYRISTDTQTMQRLRDKSASLDLAYRADAVTFKAITGFADFSVLRTADSDMSSSTVAIDQQLTAAKTFSQELQVLSNGNGPLSYVAGYYYFKDQLRGTLHSVQVPRTIRSTDPAAPATLSLAQNGAGFFDDPVAETQSNAAYAQLSWKATSQLTATLGARHTVDKKNFRFANANSVLPLNAAGAPDGTLISLTTPSPDISAFGTAGTSNCVPARGPGFYCDPKNPAVLWGATYDQKSFTKTTGRAALDYQLSKDNLAYVSYSTGFRSGGFNSGQAIESVRTFLPEEVKAIEIGSKNRFLGNKVQLNLAAYSNKYTNLQEQRQVPVGATTVSTIFNAAKAKAEGLEMELQWLATDKMTVGGTLSLLNAKYTSFPDVSLPFGTSILVADPTATTATIVDGVTIAPAGQRRIFAPGYNCRVVPGTGGAGQPAAAFGCDLTGKTVPFSPKYSGSIYSSYDFDLANGGRVTPMVITTFSSGYYGQPTNASLEKQAAYIKADLKINWEITNRWSTLFFVDNVTDKQVINRYVWGGGGAMQVSAAPPRTWGIRVAYKTF
jgi:iron complex outermembrane recepter protein